MKNKNCSSCYFGGKCSSSHICDNYSPITELDDEDIELMVESERWTFFDEWQQYVKEYSD